MTHRREATYDEAGRLAQVGGPAGTMGTVTVRYHYDQQGRVVRLDEKADGPGLGACVARYEYAGSSAIPRLEEKDCGRGVVRNERTFDGRGRVVTLVHVSGHVGGDDRTEEHFEYGDQPMEPDRPYVPAWTSQWFMTGSVAAAGGDRWGPHPSSRPIASWVDHGGDGRADEHRSYEYDGHHRLIRRVITRGEVAVRTTSYRWRGEQLVQRHLQTDDRPVERFEYAYDSRGRPIRRRHWVGAEMVDTVTYRYDCEHGIS